MGFVFRQAAFDWESEYGSMFKWIQPKIDAIVPAEWELDFIALQDTPDPWRIHIDLAWNADKLPYKVLLVPVEVLPESGPVDPNNWPDVYTIIFNQRNFLSNCKPLPPGSSWIRSINDPSVENLETGFHITKEFWQQYLTHVDYEDLEGLTVETLLPWKPRSVLYWDTSVLHIADNFIKNKIKTKKSVIFFIRHKL